MEPSLLLGKETHRELHDLLRKERRLVVSGVSNETAKAMLLSHLLSFHSQPALLVTANDASSEALRHWITFFEGQSQSLKPVTDGEGRLISEHLQCFLRFMQARPRNHHAVGKANENNLSDVFVLPRATWDTPFPLFAEMRKRSVALRVGQTLQFTEFFESLIERGHRHGDDLYLHPGEYRRIGDVLDIFPTQSSHPYRIMFTFEKVESILAVDSADLSKTEDAGEELVIFPATYDREAPLAGQFPDGTFLVLDDQDDVELPRGVSALSFTAFPESQEHHAHLRYLSVLKFYTLTDFLNDLRDKLQQEWTIVIVSKRSDELEEIFREERIPHKRSSLLDHAPFLDGETKRETLRHGSGQARQRDNETTVTSGKVILLSAHEDDLLPHSLQNPDLQCALLTDREIFSLKKGSRERSVAKLALDFITSLQAGDYVVHMDHGIGHFEGMTQKEIDGVSREYLALTYAGGDKLFVPVDQADKLSKFVHEEGEEPVLTRLGTVEWKRVTQKMRAETKEIAKELLGLYAKRAKSKGFSFGEDTKEQRAFDEAFAYTETPGQMKAIKDIKSDMESEHPMDRLICGDVGFGKTEVAMRAAFKAVQGGKQVAVIAPITILADQHYRNFLDRMRNFAALPGSKVPIQIEMLSRFRSPAEQKATLDRLRKGDVHIVIGTHRLLQEDVKFFDLGLVVIDEEQRFGVKQKEKFKEMRASVDILTLTATPIPRTLNLGLHKLRDITTITTPPPGRLPIITEVRKYSDELIRQAILAEIRRGGPVRPDGGSSGLARPNRAGGQCFVLHNRVETIDAFAQKLRTLIPEATFVVGHGQLRADHLEERIIAFKEGKCDVLVSSTIIENGIDLPRANTLIVNEAERFGLAQLYQLRGRVGRSKVQAYAYFLYHTQKLKDDAKKRLRAIVEACELGSGFQVAVRDLEIRGAGEILGANQSGTMQTVGVSHYLRMLKNAVEELKGGRRGEIEEEQQVEIQLPVEAFIPSFYITDNEEKITVYQKLAGSEDEAILAEFATDLHEEYGPLPEQVRSLFEILRLKMACRRSGVARVKQEDRDIILTLSARVTAKEIMQLLSINPQWKISGSTIRIEQSALENRAKGADWLAELTREIDLLVKKKEGKKEKETAAA
ncbi:DEAD/DEAH box helicase [Candidatus Peregrinibacteria bacterium]|nr:DEAD/DEAH box helicase [Candidatus Peregrinibacteria bacterium]MBI3816323.1 DEAD/DEAH box helicase [Candidatus Peregrinibacteria bacterium]